MAITLLTLLHVLVLVYWLGGDLGAFYGSNFMVDPKRTVVERRMALTILNNIDMAPRTMLILALPTGLALAWVKGWLDLPTYVPVLVGVASLGWLVLAWAVHLNHGGGAAIKRIDIAIRWVVLIALYGFGLAGFFKAIELPLFIALKMIVLATCISLGLVVRRQLVPLFPAIREMIATGPTPQTDATIAQVNSRARVSVVTLWLLLLVAAWLGIATPV
ncbi:hypothetical protein U5A82_13530 [Sphingobium sp. CR2-8]|uniref:hypothetical protein n=1 Tax=Sphingobium sp. CR2-8 TaxID=1306534 RepID=UPI002DB9F892|nr:hypothetical protein [Sphingobium sp. CR2-8]MEC3911446.1 hypothetical protein [Sphingobium sp. CR2-8]